MFSTIKILPKNIESHCRVCSKQRPPFCSAAIRISNCRVERGNANARARSHGSKKKSMSLGSSAQKHSCQMAIARFLDRMCLALQDSGLWLRYATLQNLIPSFPWIAPPHPPPWHNPRKGRDQILPSGNLDNSSSNSSNSRPRWCRTTPGPLRGLRTPRPGSRPSSRGRTRRSPRCTRPARLLRFVRYQPTEIAGPKFSLLN